MATLVFRITGDPASFKSAMGDVSASLDKANKRAETLSASLGRIGNTLSVGITAPIIAMGAGVVKAASEMESLRKSLDSVATATDTTEKQLARLTTLAKDPGLGLKQVITGSVALQSAGLSAQLSERSMKAFGNALATVGKGKAELDGVTLALTQMATKTKFSAEEVNQLAERLPQVRKAMLEAFGTADTEQIQKMGLSNIEIITKIVEQFEKLKQVSGGTKNSFENLQDTITTSADRIGSKLLPAVNDVIPRIEKLVIGVADAVDGFTKMPPEVKNTALAIGAVAIAAGPTIKAVEGITSVLATLRITAGLTGIAVGALFGATVLAGIAQTMSAIDRLKQKTKDYYDDLERRRTGKEDLIAGQENAGLGGVRTRESFKILEQSESAARLRVNIEEISKELNLFGLHAGEAANKANELADANKNAGEQTLWHTEHAKALTKVTAESEILQRLYTESVSAHARQIDKVTDIVRSYGVASLDSAIAAARLADEQFRLNRALEAAPDISTRLPFKDIPKAESPTFNGDFGAYKRGGENIGPEGMLTKEQARAIEERYKRTGKAGSEATRQVSLALNDLGKGLNDVIWNSRKWGDVMTGVAKQAGQALTRYVIDMGVKKVTESLLNLGGTASKVFGGIFGGGSQGGTIFSAAGGGGPVLGAGSSGGAMAGGVLGGLTGTISAVSGIASAVSGIVGNFQNAKLEGTMNQVERNTAAASIHLRYTLEKANEFWPYMKAAWESLVRMEQRQMAVVGGGGYNFDFRGATFGASFDQDAFAKNLIKTLKNNGF